MKKKMVAAIVLASVLGLGGCGGTDKTSGNGTAGTDKTTEAQTVETAAEETEAAEETALSGEEEQKMLETEYKALAKGVQDMIGERDLEKLKEAVAYPCYVGVGDGVTVDSEEEFMDLNPDEVFTDELIEAVKGADIDSLSVVKAGLVVGDPSGKPNITIGLGSDKRAGIVGINY